MKKVLGIGIILAILLGGWIGFQTWYAPYKEAKSFEGKLGPYGKRKLDLPQVEGLKEGELYRTGRVLVVIPERQISSHSIIDPIIHDSWHGLPDTIRARKPDEVSTVIRVFRDSTAGRTYIKQTGTELKYVPQSAVYLHIYDWKNQLFIGTGVLDPGDFKGDVMEGKDLDAMKDKVDVKAISKFISRLPLRR